MSCYTANVTEAYQGDPLKIRFGHAGVYETHVFHLHAHTWGAEPDDNGPAGSIPPKPTQSNQPRATTIDSQTYSPWTAFTADLNYGAGRTRRHRRRLDLPLPPLPALQRRLLVAPACARRK